MIRRLFLIIIISTPFLSKCQNNPLFITTPKLDFNLTPYGNLGLGSEFGILYPSQSNKPIINNAGIWISGKMPNGLVRASISTSENTDYTYGPLSFNSVMNLDSSQWFRVWKIEKEEVENHRLNYKEDTYVVPENIAKWPGNLPKGFDGYIVPFVDWNNNGVYEPEEGEYPVVEGNLNAFAVYNDNKENRVRSDSGLGVELKHFIYLIYNPESNQYLILNRLLATNKNNFDIKSFKLGVYVDLLLGGGKSNFVRTYPNQNAMSGYNAIGFDSVYEDKVPAFSIIFLNKELSGTTYLTSDNDAVTGMPVSANEVDNYLSGRWRNGKVLTYGGNGVDGSAQTKYVFPGTDDKMNQSFEWLEENSGSAYGERKVLLVFDSILLNSNLTTEYRFAYQITPEVNNNTEKIKQSIIKTQNEYSKGNLTQVEELLKNKDVLIFPNPILQNEVLSLKSESVILSVEITNLDGRVVFDYQNIHQSNKLSVLPNLSTGLYLIKLKTYDGIYFSKLIVR